MASTVEIYNRALIKLGAAIVTSVDDASKPARTLTAIYDTVRKSELRKSLWGFALATVELPAVSTPPAWGFANSFQLPSDFLRLVQVNDTFVDPSLNDYRQDDDSAYRIEAGTIYTDFDAPLKLRYVRDITDPGRFDPLFVEAIAGKLAYEACEAITQNSGKREQANQDYVMAKRDAYKVNAIEKPPQGWPDSSWMLGRL